MKTLLILVLVTLFFSQVLAQFSGQSLSNLGNSGVGKMANGLASAYINSNPALKAGLTGVRALSNARRPGGMMGSLRGTLPSGIGSSTFKIR